MAWEQLDLGILEEFANCPGRAVVRERAAEAWRMLGVYRSANARRVARCMARKPVAKRRAIYRKRAAARYARVKADPALWAAHQERMRARYTRANVERMLEVRA